MNSLKKQFIEFTLNHEILRFGSFTLKSGRQSPYFFNTGLCNDGLLLSSLTKFYCNSIISNKINFDFIFGPAYKGITLASSISNNLFLSNNLNKPYSSNRKEVKDHGETGIFLGFQPNGLALIVDDVISSGKSIIDSIELLEKNNAKPSSVLVCFDRMELGLKDRASIEIEDKYKIPVHSLIDLDDIVAYMKLDGSMDNLLNSMYDYMSKYKA